MPATYLNTSTFSEAVSKDANEFTVAATTNISVGSLLVANGEVFKVQAIPVSGRVVVRRGYEGTRALQHKSGARFFIGDPDDFKAIKDNAAALIGANGTYPDFCLPGTRAKDAAGNEFIMVDLTATLYGGSTIAISNDGNFTGGALKGGAHQGAVGVLVEPGTSNQYVWAQIYGLNSYATVKTTAAFTSASLATATTTVSTPDVGLAPAALSTVASYFIHGMHIVSAGTSQTSATSTPGQYGSVWLNYPYVNNYLDTAGATSA
jgi:hypothetical protein